LERPQPPWEQLERAVRESMAGPGFTGAIGSNRTESRSSLAQPIRSRPQLPHGLGMGGLGERVVGFARVARPVAEFPPAQAARVK